MNSDIVSIMNQIHGSRIAYLLIFIQTHWTSSVICRNQLVVLIDGDDDWSCVNSDICKLLSYDTCHFCTECIADPGFEDQVIDSSVIASGSQYSQEESRSGMKSLKLESDGDLQIANITVFSFSWSDGM